MSNWRDTPLGECDLSVRAFNVLHNQGYDTIGEIADKTDAELLFIHGFGRRSLWEVRLIIDALKAKADAE